MIDLYVVDLKRNKVEFDCWMTDSEVAHYHVWSGYRISWPDWDQFIWVGIEDGEVVWMKGKRQQELRALSWMIKRLSVRLFQPKPWPAWV